MIGKIKHPCLLKDKGRLNLDELILIFNDMFFASHNVRLEGGAKEPVYLPVSPDCSINRLIFRSDFISSALHEVAHWCLAGRLRRRHIDYGYWYNSDERSVAQQNIFEKVEVKPQALEWIFSIASDNTFNISIDNLNGNVESSGYFLKSVSCQALNWCSEPLPSRAQFFTKALTYYSGVDPFNRTFYELATR